MKRILKEGGYFILAILLTLSTLLIPQTVDTPQEEANITFGYPFTFAEMTSGYDGVEMSTPNPEEYNSVTYGIWGIWEHPTDFSGEGFVYSLISIWGITRLLIFGMYGLDRVKRKFTL